MRLFALIAILVAPTPLAVSGQSLEQSFREPPDSAKPWVFWFLQQGHRVVDVACLCHEGAPLNFNDIDFELPPVHILSSK